jgi:V/A-type H+-transporting ATPase subunit E
MAGLDKILEDIRSESAAAVASVTGKAHAERDKVLAEAAKDANAQAEKILSHAKSQADDLIARADSAAQLQRRRMLLETKQELIASVIDKAKQAILELPDSDYFDLILKLIGGNALPRECEICFNRKDFARLPKDFASKLVASLPAGAKLNVSKDEADINGGFILKYDGIEQNLSLDEIFEENRDRMTDAAGKLLFS